jgi:hypothetical protein
MRVHLLALLLLLCGPALAACGDADDAPDATPATVTETVTTEATPEPVQEESEEPAPEVEKQTTFGPFTAPEAEGVSLVDVGWAMKDGYLGVYGHVGAVFYNNGPTVPHVEVTLQGIHDDDVVDSSTVDLVSVPAYSFFVVGGTLTEMESETDTVEVVPGEGDSYDLGDAGGTTVIEAATPAAGHGEPVSVRITNNGPRTVDDSMEVFVVLVDDQGKVVSGGDGFTNLPVPAGQTVRDVVDNVYVPPGTTQALAYVNAWLV